MKNKAKLILYSVGFILLFLSVKMFYSQNRFLQNSVKTEAEIVSYKIVKGSQHRSSSRNLSAVEYYQPIFKFKNQNNKMIEVKSNVGDGNSRPYAIGTKIEIRYSKENPENAKVNSFRDQYFFPSFLTAFSLFLLFIGWILPRKCSKKHDQVKFFVFFLNFFQRQKP